LKLENKCTIVTCKKKKNGGSVGIFILLAKRLTPKKGGLTSDLLGGIVKYHLVHKKGRKKEKLVGMFIFDLGFY